MMQTGATYTAPREAPTLYKLVINVAQRSTATVQVTIKSEFQINKVSVAVGSAGSTPALLFQTNAGEERREIGEYIQGIVDFASSYSIAATLHRISRAVRGAPKMYIGNVLPIGTAAASRRAGGSQHPGRGGHSRGALQYRAPTLAMGYPGQAAPPAPSTPTSNMLVPARFAGPADSSYARRAPPAPARQGGSVIRLPSSQALYQVAQAAADLDADQLERAAFEMITMAARLRLSEESSSNPSIIQ